MTGPSASLPEPRELDGLAPLIGRIEQANPTAHVRVRATPTVISLFSREPFDVLISRSVARVNGSGQDYTCTAAGLRAWIENAPQPADLSSAWRGSLPPVSGWQLIDPIPADVIDTITSNGAKILHDLRGEIDADLRSAAALDSVVLTVESGDGQPPGRAQPQAGHRCPATRLRCCGQLGPSARQRLVGCTFVHQRRRLSLAFGGEVRDERARRAAPTALTPALSGAKPHGCVGRQFVAGQWSGGDQNVAGRHGHRDVSHVRSDHEVRAAPVRQATIRSALPAEERRGQLGELAAQLKCIAVQRQHRVLVIQLRLDRLVTPVRRHRKPRVRRCAEAVRGSGALPRDWHPLTVATSVGVVRCVPTWGPAAPSRAGQHSPARVRHRCR